MGKNEAVYIDLQVLGRNSEGNYVVEISPADLASLVVFSPQLVIRHWDGQKPLVLERYGDAAVRTRDDESVENNLENLPTLSIQVSKDRH